MSDRRAFRALLAATGVSAAGTTMTFLAVPWFVLETTGSALQTGMVAFAETVPLVLSAGLGAPLVDRVGARRASALTDGVSAAVVLAVPLLHLLGVLRLPVLLALVAVLGLTRAPAETARYALVPEVAAASSVPLERATSLYDAVGRAARMVGAPAAGVLIATAGAPAVLVADAATFVVAAVVVLAGLPALRVERQVVEPYLVQLREGLRYLRRDRLVGAITAMVLVTNTLDAAVASVLLPVYAAEVLDSAVALGLASGAFGAAALLGALAWAAFGPRLPRRQVFTAAFLVVGAPRLLGLALEPGLVALLVLMVVTGMLCGVINPVLTAVEYERVPAELRSRVFGATAAAVLAGMPLGALVAGASVEAVGLQATLVGAGVLYGLVTLCPLVFPVWRGVDRRSVARAPVPETLAA